VKAYRISVFALFKKHLKNFFCVGTPRKGKSLRGVCKREFLRLFRRNSIRENDYENNTKVACLYLRVYGTVFNGGVCVAYAKLYVFKRNYGK
jgi:hypothetical protein